MTDNNERATTGAAGMKGAKNAHIETDGKADSKADSKIETKEQKRKRLEAELAVLGRAYTEAVRVGARPGVLRHFTDRIAERKIEIADMDAPPQSSRESRESQDEVRRQALAIIDDDLEILYDEQTRIEREIQVKENERERLAPGGGAGAARPDDGMEDMQRLQESMVDRHKKYREMYGCDPT